MEYIKAFLIGGLICLIGQILLAKTSITPARILVIYVVLGTVLYTVGLYGGFAEWAGAGARVPLTGFGGALAKGAIEGAKENGLLGALSGGLKATAAGISAAIVFGYLAALIFTPKDKQ